MPVHLWIPSPVITVASTPTPPAITLPSTPDISRSPTPSFSFGHHAKLPSEDNSDSDYADTNPEPDGVIIERVDIPDPRDNTNPQPEVALKSKITDWFQRCTLKEQEEQMQRSRGKDMETHEEFQRLECLRQLRADEEQRKSNTESQRRVRERKRQHEIEEGRRGANGKKLKITVNKVGAGSETPQPVLNFGVQVDEATPVTEAPRSEKPLPAADDPLAPSDTPPSPGETRPTDQTTSSPPEIHDSHLVGSVLAIAAQDTRPSSRKVLAALLDPPKKVKRVSGKAQMPKNPVPQKRKRGPRYNWFNPLVWQIIDATARKSNYPWSPTAIANQLKKDYPSIFRKFSHQRVSEWRDHSSTHELIWKAEVLEKVKRQGAVKRSLHTSGVLVRHFSLLQIISPSPPTEQVPRGCQGTPRTTGRVTSSINPP